MTHTDDRRITSSSAASHPAPTKVVYVMGAGRSGSTILGVVLGTCEGLFYAGELDGWLRRSGEPAYDHVDGRDFWRRVAASVDADPSLFGEACHRQFEHSLLALLPRRRLTSRRALRERYRHVSRRLYVAARAEAGSDVIVDSSHYPLRAATLRSDRGLDLHLVWLVRSPTDVVASFREAEGSDHKGLIAANAYLWATHLLSLLVFLSHRSTRRTFVRYESFVKSPQRHVDRLLSVVGVQSQTVIPADMPVGVPFGGNRILKAGRVTLRPSRRDVPGRWDGFTAGLQAPWRFAFAMLDGGNNLASDRDRIQDD